MSTGRARSTEGVVGAWAMALGALALVPGCGDAASPPPMMCQPGAFLRCADGGAVACAVSGMTEVTLPCPFGCSAELSGCRACQPFAKRCATPTRLLYCVADGSRQTDLDCDDGNPCTVASCHDDVCDHQPRADGTVCPIGTCISGECHCGHLGELCCGADASCFDGLLCQQSSCGDCGGAGKPCCANGYCRSPLVCFSDGPNAGTCSS